MPLFLDLAPGNRIRIADTTVTIESPKLRIRAELPDELNPEANYQI